MRRGPQRLLAAVLAAAAAAVWLAWPVGVGEGDGVRSDCPAGPRAAVRAGASVRTAAPGPHWFDALPAGRDGDGLARVPLAPVDGRASAWTSLAQAREHGDERAPPIERTAPGAARLAPTAAELADPAAYQQYERGREARVLAAYAAAAQAELPKLRADVERARQAGIAPERIAKVEEKIRRIEAQRQAIVEAHPGLAAPR